MKLVIKIGSIYLDDRTALCRFAKAVLHLVSDHHQVTVVHGGSRLRNGAEENINSAPGQITRGVDSGETALMFLGVNKNLVAVLRSTGVTSLGLCGADGGVLVTRERFRKS